MKRYKPGVPKAAERFQAGPEAAGPGEGARGPALEALLQVTTVWRVTPYLSAIRVGTAYLHCHPFSFPAPTLHMPT